MASYGLDFTDGDTFKRITILDPDCTPRSRVTVAIQRRNVADVDDVGWSFTPNVALVDNGRFDVNVSVLSMDSPAAAGEFPNEFVDLHYDILD